MLKKTVRLRHLRVFQVGILTLAVIILPVLTVWWATDHNNAPGQILTRQFVIAIIFFITAVCAFATGFWFVRVLDDPKLKEDRQTETNDSQRVIESTSDTPSNPTRS
jgi:uncharacterized membrane protein